MIKRFLLTFLLCMPYVTLVADDPLDSESRIKGDDGAVEYDIDSWVLANEIIQELIDGKTPDEIRAMLDILTAALNDASLCGVPSIQALIDVGFPFGEVLDSLVKACDLQGPQIAELARSLTPGVGGDGGPGGPVSP